MSNYEKEILDLIVKTKAVVEYCEPNLDKMWAARVVGILLGCDFRDAKDHLEGFYNYCEEKGI